MQTLRVPRTWLRKDVLHLTLPVMLEQTFLMSLGIVNTIMASRIGEEAVSAIGMVDSIHNIFIAFFSALAVGGTVVVAQLTGQSRTREANDAVQQSLFSGLLLSIAVMVALIFVKHPLIGAVYASAEPQVLSNAYLYFDITVLTYPLISLSTIAYGVLRGAGDTRTPMKINVAINVINLVLSYVMIYGIGPQGEALAASPYAFHINGMGVKGAAIAVSIARGLGAVAVLFVLFRGTKQIRLGKIHRFRFNWGLQRSIFGVGIPSSLESLMFNSGKLITQVFIVGMGTAAIASNYIGGSMNSLTLIPGNALGIVATTMVGQAMGRKDTKEANFLMWYLFWVSNIVQAVILAIFFPVAPLMATLYSQDPEVIRMSSTLFRMALVATPLAWSASFLLPAALKGAGDAKYTLITAVIGMWTFRIGTGWLYAIPLGFGVAGIWMGMFTDWVVRGILFALRVRSGKWKERRVLADDGEEPRKVGAFEV